MSNTQSDWFLFVLALVLTALVMLGSGCSSCRVPSECPQGWTRLEMYDRWTPNALPYRNVCVSPDGKIDPAR